MSPRDSQQLHDFLIRLTHVGYVQKDPQAAEAVAAAFSVQPDAAYLAVQRCLQLEKALAEAQERIAVLEQQQVLTATARLRGNGWYRPHSPAPSAP